MDNQKPQLARGLRDVIAGQTSICLLDEENERLYYRGYAIEDLAAHSTFEETVCLLLSGELPETKSREGLSNGLYLVDDSVLSTLKWQRPGTHPMDLLATLIRVFGNGFISGRISFNDAKRIEKDLQCSTEDFQKDSDKMFSRILCAYTGYFVGIMKRWYENQLPLRMPKVYKSLAKNILYQMYGFKPYEFENRLLDITLILYAEHEFNASTFAVRVAASAHADIFSAIVAGIGTLNGSRHGGANEEAMKMVLEIGTPENVRAYCDRFFETPGARLPGFGHAVYTRSDPRVAILRPKVRELSKRKGNMRWYEICLALEEYMRERAAQKGRGIPANVDLWIAPLYYLLDIPISMYTPLFAAARVAGWCAHYLEVRHENNEPIIRPRAEYVGPAPRPFLPIEQRETGNRD